MHRQMSGLAGRPGPKSSGQGGSKASAVCDQRKLYAIKKIGSSDFECHILALRSISVVKSNASTR